MRLHLLSVCLLIAGCATKYDALTPDLRTNMLSELQAGKLNLDCGLKCDVTFIAQASNLQALDLSEHWEDLAEHVMQIGYGNDLGYYYLGQAAQGLGYQQAAIGYYTYAIGLNQGHDGFLQCASGRTATSDPCQGVDLAGSIPVLVQASHDAIAQKQIADEAADEAASRAKSSYRHKSNPKPSTSGWVAPPPPPPSN